MRNTLAVVGLYCVLSLTAAAGSLEDANTALRLGDFARAVTLFEAAALQGEPQAQYQLGQLHLAGRGVPVDREKGLDWLEQAAQNKHTKAQYVLGLSLWQDGDGAGLDWLKKSAEAGHERARRQLLLIAQSELESPAPQDQAEALSRWWRDSINCRPEALVKQVQRGMNVNVRDTHGRTALHYLAACEEEHGMARLLAAGANPVVDDVYGVQPVDTAIQRDNAALLEILLAAGANPDRRLTGGDRLLHLAVRVGAVQSLARLLPVAQQINALDAQAYTPLDRASILHSEAVRDILLAAGAIHGAQWQRETRALLHKPEDSQASDSQLRWSAAVRASLQNQPGQLHTLDKEQGGLPLAFVDEQGRTLLMYSVQAGASDSVRYLLQRGADPGQSNEAGITALMLAAQHGQRQLVVQLLRHGAAVLARNAQGQDAILLALQAGADDLAMVLLESEAQGIQARSDEYLRAAIVGQNHTAVAWILPRLKSPNTLDSSGRSALWLASRQCNEAAVGRLLTLGARANIADKQGLAPLHVAASSGCSRIIGALLRAGVDKDAQTRSGNTALMLAVQRECSDAATILIAAGASVSQPNAVGDTALLHAVRGGCQSLLQPLLAAGADPFRRNEQGQSAMGLAETHSPELAAYLRSQRGLRLPLLD